MLSCFKIQNNAIRNIWILSAKEIGFGTESTVDGIHPNNTGMVQYANAYAKKLMRY